jgi:hypothetical protein
MKPLRFLALGAFALTACSGGGGDEHPFHSAWCASMGGTVTVTTDAACSACSVGDPAAAADGALGSFAELAIPPYANATGITIRATSGEHPAGGWASVFIRIPESAQAWTGIMRTYLDGVEQESVPYSGSNYYPNGNPEDVYGMFAIETGKPFDAIELQVANAGYNTAPFDFRVYEFCSDAGSDYANPR